MPQKKLDNRNLGRVGRLACLPAKQLKLIRRRDSSLRMDDYGKVAEAVVTRTDGAQFKSRSISQLRKVVSLLGTSKSEDGGRRGSDLN